MMILNALENDSKNNGVGLTIFEIAREVFGNFHKDTTDFHIKKVRELMYAVCELGAANNLIVYAKKVSTNPKTPDVKSRNARWMIYNHARIGAQEELIEALIDKKKRGEARTNSFIKMLNMAKDQRILTEGIKARLGISLQ